MTIYIETANLCQKAVLWPFAGYDNFGEPRISEGEEINVRWETREILTIDENGNQIAYPARVYVEKRIYNGSMMWLGKLAEVADPAENVFEVVSYREIPSLDADELRRTVILQRGDDVVTTPIAGVKRKKVTITGDDVTTEFTITHNFDLSDPNCLVINVWDATSNKNRFVPWQTVDANSIKIVFDVAPATGDDFDVFLIA